MLFLEFWGSIDISAPAVVLGGNTGDFQAGWSQRAHAGVFEPLTGCIGLGLPWLALQNAALCCRQPKKVHACLVTI